jgi:NAD(P)-dependent dehydrogenase (short-subunit alcohol dehydrogenase family)
VAVLDIDRKALDTAVREKRGIEAAIQADVSDPAQVARAFRETDGLFGGVDVLIANAGISIRKDFVEIPDEQWARVILLAKTMALELAPFIRVNAVCPGYVLTPMQKAEYTPETLDAMNLKIPMKRHADSAEVAALFAFLASDEAAYITGAEICIDGGETAGLS